MHCRDCSRFDIAARKCRDGKVNPQTWGESIEVANHLGVRCICVFNDYREKLVSTRVVQFVPRRAGRES